MDPTVHCQDRAGSATGCWNWTASRDPGGYGKFGMSGSDLRCAHRIAHELWTGPIPAGYQVDHLCRNRRCVRPDHLEAVSPAVNQHRGVGFAGVNHRKTHCPHGHAYDDENTWISGQGGRFCRMCRDGRNRQAVADRKLRRANQPIRTVVAFGESKSIASWSRDARCAVSYATLYSRLYAGVAAEVAITTPTGRSLLAAARRSQ